jgi:hypothetical protein
MPFEGGLLLLLEIIPVRFASDSGQDNTQLISLWELENGTQTIRARPSTQDSAFLGIARHGIRDEGLNDGLEGLGEDLDETHCDI